MKETEWRHFHKKCLRRILNIKRLTMTTDTKILGASNPLSVESMSVLNQMRWTEHIVCMQDSWFLKYLFYDKFKADKCPQYKLKKRFRDCSKENIAFDMDVSDWEELSLDKDKRKKSIKDGSILHESSCIESEKLKHGHRKLS